MLEHNNAHMDYWYPITFCSATHDPEEALAFYEASSEFYPEILTLVRYYAEKWVEANKINPDPEDLDDQ